MSRSWGRTPFRSTRKASLARRLAFALAIMLLPLVAVVVTGLFGYRSSVAALRDFRAEVVTETTHIEGLRELLVEIDDVGETYVEERDPIMLDRFTTLSREIDRGFEDIMNSNGRQQQQLALAASERWGGAVAALGTAVAAPSNRNGDNLDRYHDLVDEAGALVSDVYSSHISGLADELSDLRVREQLQLLAALGTLVISSILAGLVARRTRRSINIPLLSLEEAAARFGANDLSHRVRVVGDDELARLGAAFNAMAGKLQESTDALNHQALHDPLTGLANRTLFMEQMENAIARARRRGTPFSVLYLDLDGFKAVNDTLGHDAGDELLVAVSKRLSNALRDEDTAARLGGDEFGVVLEEADATGAARTAERLTEMFREWDIETTDALVSVSIGVATSRGEEKIDELLRRADEAMYAAKSSGKDQWRAFGPTMQTGAIQTRSLRTELQRAVEEDEFVVHYQPIIDLGSNVVEGVEALVRWDHPTRGLIAPFTFLKEAEESGHILYIDRWVLHEASRQVRTWQSTVRGAGELSAFVNLSARQLQHPGLEQEVVDALRSSGLSPENLTLEITETMLVRDAEVAAMELGKVKRSGVKLALDDFGTGHSSLSYLLKFPIDIIKIDRSFIAAMAGSDKRSDVAAAIINLSKTLGLGTVAEGIEDPRQLERLRSFGCDLGQGYYLGKPLPAGEIGSLLTRQPVKAAGRSTAG